MLEGASNNVRIIINMIAKELIELAKPHYTDEQIERLEKAVKFADLKHQGQKRLSGDPYISHPLSVAAILIEWKMDIDSVLAGVLHDTVEDGSGTLDDITSEVGKSVSFLVDGVTKVSQARSGMGNIDTYLPKTKDNLSKLLIAVCHDIRVLLIKLADRLHNLRTVEYLPPDRREKVAQESINVFAPLADRLGMGQVKIEIEEISFKYLNPKEYHKLIGIIKKRLGRSHKKLDDIKSEISVKLSNDNIPHRIDGRIKSTYSLFKKLKKVDIDHVYDLMALRIVVENKEDCYRVLGALHSLYQPMLTKIKDYISVPKPNGYQSLHTTVLTHSQQIVEFQIRSQSMHEYAERGLAASFHYNEQKLTKNYIEKRSIELPRSMLWITELQELAQKVQKGEASYSGVPIDIFSDRIFVYSPKGDIYDLPEGSTALDFAFLVHTDIGKHAYSAKVNNRITKLGAVLNNGDIVEIQTRSNIKPNKDWVNLVTTAKARQRIRSVLKKE